MSGFFYFLPGAKPSDNPANLSRWGLAYLIDGEGTKPWACPCLGPGGVNGMILGSPANFAVEEVKNSDRIEWVKFPKTFAESPDIAPSLGWIKGQPLPGPSDLARVKQISGEYHTLVDGNRWLLPVAKQVTEDGYSTNLPTSYGLDEETGDWITDSVVPQYRAIWKHANEYWEAMNAAILNQVEGEQLTWVIPDGNSLVQDAMQANYRVSARELATLGVLVSGIHQLIADTLIDMNGWAQLKKKADPDTGRG